MDVDHEPDDAQRTRIPENKAASQPGDHRPANVNDLPYELLSSIILCWTEVDEEAAWMASMVSQQWRRIVLDCPSAWSKIHISLLPKSAQEEHDPEWCIEEDYLEWLTSPRGKARPLHLWAQRAGDTIITLSIRAASTVPYVDQKIVDIAKELMGLAVKLRHLKITSESSSFLDGVVPMFCTISRTWQTVDLTLDPSVVRTTMHHDVGEFRARLEDIWKTLQPAEDLRKLSFRRCLPTLQGDFLAASSRLTHLTIHDADGDHAHMLQVLSKCGNLISLNLSFRPLPATSIKLDHFDIDPDPPTTAPTPFPDFPIILPSLIDISFDKMATDTCGHYLQWLSTPSLRHFAMQNLGLAEIEHRIASDEKTYEIMAPFGDSMTAFMQRVTCLQTMQIVNSPLPDRQMLQVLSHLSDLQELSLGEMNVGGLLLRGLGRVHAGTKPNAPLVTCRELKILKLVDCDFVTGTQLVELVRRRSCKEAEIVPLQRLDVEACVQVLRNDLDVLYHDHPLLALRYIAKMA
ncbi:hypothetical protein EIP91_012102 [Steccherinum ochraceum]|uniref:F-box domain-containing protein n=1 Tax=Steccherinum ochraceum TaxID=92696 RepID=A0A4R0S3B4_9APHY|nr:hypothetical protein EIP91_012102 [Steccherinum ochraceum]